MWGFVELQLQMAFFYLFMFFEYKLIKKGKTL